MTLNNNNNKRKSSNTKVVRCGNQRVLFSLKRPTMFRIILRVFVTTRKRRRQIGASWRCYLLCLLLGNLDDLEGSNNKHNYQGRDGQYLVKTFTYQQPFGFHHKCHHQVDNHNNRCHSPISPERTWATKFWPDHNFARYLSIMETNTALESGPFQNGINIMPTLPFWKQLLI